MGQTCRELLQRAGCPCHQGRRYGGGQGGLVAVAPGKAGRGRQGCGESRHRPWCAPRGTPWAGPALRRHEPLRELSPCPGHGGGRSQPRARGTWPGAQGPSCAADPHPAEPGAAPGARGFESGNRAGGAGAIPIGPQRAGRVSWARNRPVPTPGGRCSPLPRRDPSAQQDPLGSRGRDPEAGCAAPRPAFPAPRPAPVMPTQRDARVTHLVPRGPGSRSTVACGSDRNRLRGADAHGPRLRTAPPAGPLGSRPLFPPRPPP